MALSDLVSEHSDGGGLASLVEDAPATSGGLASLVDDAKPSEPQASGVRDFAPPPAPEPTGPDPGSTSSWLSRDQLPVETKPWPQSDVETGSSLGNAVRNASSIGSTEGEQEGPVTRTLPNWLSIPAGYADSGLQALTDVTANTADAVAPLFENPPPITDKGAQAFRPEGLGQKLAYGATYAAAVAPEYIYGGELLAPAKGAGILARMGASGLGMTAAGAAMTKEGRTLGGAATNFVFGSAFVPAGAVGAMVGRKAIERGMAPAVAATIERGVAAGTIGIPTYVYEKAAGAPDQEAFVATILNGAMTAMHAEGTRQAVAKKIGELRGEMAGMAQTGTPEIPQETLDSWFHTVETHPDVVAANAEVAKAGALHAEALDPVAASASIGPMKATADELALSKEQADAAREVASKDLEKDIERSAKEAVAAEDAANTAERKLREHEARTKAAEGGPSKADEIKTEGLKQDSAEAEKRWHWWRDRIAEPELTPLNPDEPVERASMRAASTEVPMEAWSEPSPAKRARAAKSAPPPTEPPSPAAKSAPESRFPEGSTSARMEQMNKNLIGFDKSPTPDPEARHWNEVLQQAKDERGDLKADLLAAEVLTNPRAFSDVETAGVVLKAAFLKGQHRELADRIRDSRDVEETRDLSVQMRRIEDSFEILAHALRTSGTEKGRALAAQKLTIDQDFDLVSVLTRAKAAKRESLTPDERKRFEKLIEQHEAAQAELKKNIADLEAQLAEKTKAAAEAGTEKGKRDREANMDEAVNGLKREAAKGGKRKPVDLDKQNARITEGIKKRIEEGDAPTDLGDWFQKLALNHVRRGVTEREALVDAVHADVAPILGKEWTRDQTMDAVSGYGDFKELDKEPAKVLLRKLKGEMQQRAKIRDMENKLAPKKTGIERRDMGDEERRLQKIVNEMKKLGGYVVTDPARQLKSAMDAIKTRLRNHIRDLDLAISTREPMVKKTGGIEYDAQATALKVQRDAKQAEYDAIFKPEGLTDAQRLKMVTAAAERSLADWQKRLENAKAGKFDPLKPERAAVTSRELEAIRAQREAIKDEYDLLHELAFPKLSPEEIALKAFKAAKSRRIASLRERVALGERTVRPKRNVKLDMEAENLLAESLDLAKQLKEITSEPERLAALDKQIATLKAQRDHFEVTRELIAAQQRKGPRVPPRQSALLERRIYDRDRLRKDINAKIKEIRPGKVGRSAVELANTMRSLMTSYDLSAVLRQGAFIGLGHPVRAAKAIGPMLRAFGSKAAAHAEMARLHRRPNAPLYARAKLYLADIEGGLTGMEENYMSHWAGRIPGVGGSERAYTTYLNRLRADSFDTMASTLTMGREPTLVESKIIANYINVATGRGNLGELEQGAVMLNTFFFAPKYVVSRFQLALGHPLLARPKIGGLAAPYRGTWRVRGKIAKEYVRFATGMAAVMGLGYAAGARIETDSNSPDFMKLRFGKVRLDPWAGMAQGAVLTSRLISGETKSSVTGKVTPIRGNVPFGRARGWDVMSNFVRTKFSPVIGTGIDLLSGENVVGQKVTPATAALNMIGPLSPKDIYSAAQSEGIDAAIPMGVLSTFGMGLQTYGNRSGQSTGSSEYLPQ